MTVPQDSTFGTFIDGGDLVHDDIVVGLRNGLNTRFNFKGDPGLYLPLLGGTMQGAIDMNGFIITGLPAPTSPTDAVNKAYADALIGGTALTKADDTNVTLTLGGTPATALIHAVSLTLGWTGQLSVPRGGSGAASFTAYSLVCGGTTSTGALQNVSGLGTLNQVLISQGAGALPVWGSVPGVVPAALTEVNDTNVTLTLGGTPTTSLLQAVSLTLGWTGVLSGTRGGTGVNNGASTATYAGNLSFAAAFTTVGAFAATQTYTGITNVTFPTTGTLATTADLPTGAALTKTDDTNVTLTLGGSPTTALLNAASLTLGWTGQLGLTRGGTGASLTASNGGIVYSNASTLAILAGTATPNLPLLSGTSAAPSWGAFALNLGGALTTAAALTTAGAFAATFTFTGITGVTFPTSGTLATTSQIPSGAALTKTDDTNVTLTLGGSPTTALVNAASLTLGWTGILSVPRGGTGLAAITAHNLLIGNGTSAATLLAPSATSGIPLISQGASADPAYGTAVVEGGGTGAATFTAYAVLCAGITATGAFQNVSGVGTSGQALISNGAAALPTWQNIPAATLPTGALFNFQSTNTTTTTSVASGTMTDITNLSVSITPTNASNKVLVRAVIQGSSGAGVAAYQLVRTSTAIGNGAAAGSRTVCGGVQWGTAQANVMGTVVIEFLDTPATTSATTYKVQMSALGGSGTAYCNQSFTDTDLSAFPRTSSTISVYEVKA